MTKSPKPPQLSMREALLPVCLVTLLFFLWVSSAAHKCNLKHMLTSWPGTCVRPPRHPQQALPDPPRHITSTVVRSPSGLFRRLPSCISSLCQLDPTPFRLQGRLYVRPLPLRYWCIVDVACCHLPFLWWLLRRHFHHR